MDCIKASLILGLGIAATATAVAGEKIPAAELTVPLVYTNVQGATIPYRVAALWAVDGKIRYREYPGVGHNCWAPTYADWGNVLSWFFAQRKGK